MGRFHLLLEVISTANALSSASLAAVSSSNFDFAFVDPSSVADAIPGTSAGKACVWFPRWLGPGNWVPIGFVVK